MNSPDEQKPQLFARLIQCQLQRHLFHLYQVVGMFHEHVLVEPEEFLHQSPHPVPDRCVSGLFPYRNSYFPGGQGIFMYQEYKVICFRVSRPPLASKIPLFQSLIFR